MSNEHNPIAYAVSLLQEKWISSIDAEHYQLIRWLIEKQNLEIFKGFLKLESSIHGKLDEPYIIMYTPFESIDEYAYCLADDWLKMFEKEKNSNIINSDWDDFDRLKNELEKLKSQPISKESGFIFLSNLLKSFKRFEGGNNSLILGLIPNGIISEDGFCNWIGEFLNFLPQGVSLMTVDFSDNETQQELLKKEDDFKKTTIIAKDLFDAKEIYRELATSGNPNDPQLEFRKCLFEMGEASKQGNKIRVKKWGDESLLITQRGGNKLLWASAHLTYAGFLFVFKDTESIKKLFEKGIRICEDLLFTDPQNKESTVGLLGQFYGYEAAYFNILKKYKKSIDCFMKQAKFFVQNNQKVLSIGAFQNALIVAERNKKDRLAEIAEQGFEVGYALDDKSLQVSSFAVIAYYYIETRELEEVDKQNIELRMIDLYGEDWNKGVQDYKSLLTSQGENS